MYCLETKDLTHRFSGNEVVLNNINLQVNSGAIYGFLGPNGAGKTTTLRLVLGLLKKQRGDIYIFGKPFEKNRVDLLRSIGSLIETPSVYGHLSAMDNLGVLQKIYQCKKTRLAEVLELVGLSEVGNKKASKFSLGMKQRLGIAIALLNNPSLLILDEPTNGLDPNGILEIRELLKTLNQQHGVTIIISSHLLSEIEKLVTHIAIINKGNLMFQGTLNELVNKQQQASNIFIETNDNALALQIIERNMVSANIENGRIVMAAISKTQLADINKQLVQNCIDVFELYAAKNNLETVFMDLINT